MTSAASPGEPHPATDADFEGHEGRECGDHRSTGRRAWCHDDTERCYPESPCRGCELPQLRAELDLLGEQRDAVLACCDDTSEFDTAGVLIRSIRRALGETE